MKLVFKRVMRLIEEYIKLCFLFNELTPDNFAEFELKYNRQTERCVREKNKLKAEIKYFRHH